MNGSTSKKRAAGRSRVQAKPLGRSKSGAGRAKPLSADERERRGRQVIRHLMILAALAAAPRGLTVKDLLQVVGDGTIRTAYRDLNALEAAGFALAKDGGRWHLDPRSRVSLPIGPEELVALLVATQGLGHASPFTGALEQLRRKLLVTLTPTARAYCEELADTAAATTLGSAAAPAAVVSAVQDALAREHTLEIAHARPGEPPRTRVVEPYATWVASGRPYLVARCVDTGLWKHFHLARIRTATVLDEPFDRDSSFDLSEYVTRGFGAFHGAVHDVAIELDREVAHVARETELHPSQSVEALPDGGARLTLRTAGLPPLAAWVAGFGGKARVTEPAALAEMVRAIGEGAARGHGGRGEAR